MPKRTLKSLLLFTLMIGSTSSYSQQEKSGWYQIEVLIFAQQSGYQRSSELWRDSFDPDYSQKPIRLSQPDAADISREPFLQLPTEHRTLTTAAQRIQKAADLRLLTHLAWRQQVTGKAEAQSILIQTGKRFGSEFELEGTLTISKERYLHARSKLFFSQFKAVEYGQQLDWSVFREQQQRSDSSAWKSEQRDLYNDNSNNAYGNRPVEAPTTASKSQFIRAATAKLSQSRRMRSDELHYIDHPLFGMVVKISPYKQPDPVLQIQQFKPQELPGKRSLPASGNDAG